MPVVMGFEACDRVRAEMLRAGEAAWAIAP